MTSRLRPPRKIGFAAPNRIHFNGMFGKLMRESGLLQAASGGRRTLYSLRHTYATEELLAGTDIHTLSKQMGTSVRMLEAHYSKLTATMAAERLA
jgi:integrase